MLAVASVIGEVPLVALSVLVNSAAWVAAIVLSVQLASGRRSPQHPLLYVVPTLVVIPFVHDTYLLGQPVLILLALLLGAFACLRAERPWSAGALIGLAAAIKAFPVLALGYLVYRRQAKAAVATILSLVLWLLVIPAPIRGAQQAWSDLATWTRGMVLKYDEDAIAQRPERSYSFKNQSLIALANRLLRSIPADGEAKDGWMINIADLDFRSVNLAILGASGVLCAFYLIALARAGRVPEQSYPIETAMLLVLVLAFNPLSFDYTFVWLIYPLTVVLYRSLEAPPGKGRDVALAGFVTAVVVFALALVSRRTAQAYGNLLASALVLLLTLACELFVQEPHASSRRGQWVKGAG
jgi:hypothetical protein